jgi:hypothetical protein
MQNRVAFKTLCVQNIPQANGKCPAQLPRNHQKVLKCLAAKVVEHQTLTWDDTYLRHVVYFNGAQYK